MLSLTRGQYQKAGLILLALGLVLGLAGATMVFQSIKVRKTALPVAKAKVNQCRERLKTLGFEVSDGSGSSSLKAANADLSKSMRLLADASIASLACPGWRLVRFCLGEKCDGGPGVTLEIKKDP